MARINTKKYRVYCTGKKGDYKTDSLVDARRAAVDMMIKSNGRFVYSEIYTGNNAYPNPPKYTIQVIEEYSRPRDALAHGHLFGIMDSRGKLIGRVNLDGTIAKRY